MTRISKVKDEENKENINLNSTEGKNRSNISYKEEDSKLNGLSLEKKDENKNNSTDTIQKLSLSKNSEINLQIEKNNNKTISYNNSCRRGL